MPQPASHPGESTALLRGVSRSFYLSIRLLPAPLRRPIVLAYLLARATDTVADTAQVPQAQRRRQLELLAEAIDGRIPAADTASLASSFAPLQSDLAERDLILGLPHCVTALDSLQPADRDDVRAVLRRIVRGQALDVERFGDATSLHALETAAQLDEYTYLVAGCVGEFWTDLCLRHVPRFATLPAEQMRELGRRYGMALQLVNILRDAGADLASGRCYFPADELAAAGLQPKDVAVDRERFAAVREHWLGQAQRGLEMGMRYADAVNSRRVRAASALPALLGARTLALLRADSAHGLANRVKVPRGEVRATLARLAWTLAGRRSLQAMFDAAAAAP